MAARQIEFDFGALATPLEGLPTPADDAGLAKPTPVPSPRSQAAAVPAPATEARVAQAPAAARPRALSRERLQAMLERRLGEAVVLVITDNERTMISTRRHPGLRQVRLHHMFLRADADTLAALFGYLDRSRPDAGEQLGSFIEQHRGHIRKRTERRVRLDTEGKHHDLSALFAKVNAEYFDGEVDARITWARRTKVEGARRSIKLGSYSSRDALIRIHPVLDASWVPSFFVEYIIYHEMLHQVVPPRVEGGRRQLHSREFCRAERAFAEYDRAIAWEKRHLRRLLKA